MASPLRARGNKTALPGRYLGLINHSSKVNATETAGPRERENNTVRAFLRCGSGLVTGTLLPFLSLGCLTQSSKIRDAPLQLK